MNGPSHLLSVVTNSDGRMVSIHADLAGVELLLEELTHLRDQLLKDDCPHTHLFSFIPGDSQLTTTKLSDQEMEVTTVDHVQIYGWNAEWAIQHGLLPESRPNDG